MASLKNTINKLLTSILLKKYPNKIDNLVIYDRWVGKDSETFANHNGWTYTIKIYANIDDTYRVESEDEEKLRFEIFRTSVNALKMMGLSEGSYYFDIHYENRR